MSRTQPRPTLTLVGRVETIDDGTFTLRCRSGSSLTVSMRCISPRVAIPPSTLNQLVGVIGRLQPQQGDTPALLTVERLEILSTRRVA